jgi:hypothetical protein
MRGRHEPKLAVASLRRRLLASLIDVLAGILTLVIVIGTAALAFALGRKRGVGGGLLGHLGSGGQDISRRLGSRPTKLMLELTALAAATFAKQRRSPGFRVLGLRLVDVRTGGELSRQQEIIRATTRQVWRALCRRLVPMPKPPASPEQEKLRSQMEAARIRCAGDPDTLQREVIRIHRENKVQPLRISCLPALARPLLVAAIDLPAFWSPLKQSLPDRLAAVATIREGGR